MEGEERTVEEMPGEEQETLPGEETALPEAEAPTEGENALPEDTAAGVDRRQEVETFLQAFPGVEAGDIPAQVWAQAAGGLGLTGAWALYENSLLRQALAALEQNGENRARSLGSLGSRQSVSGGGSIDSYWEEAGP